MKKYISVILTALLFVSLACFASADEYSFFNSYSADISKEQMQELNEFAQKIVDEYNFVPIIADYWTNNLDDYQGTADSVFYNNNLGIDNGIVLVTDAKKYYVATYGNADNYGFGYETVADSVYKAYSVTYDSGFYTGAYAMLNYVNNILDIYSNSGFADSTEGYTDYLPVIESVVSKDGFVTDNAGLLSAEEETALEAKLEGIKEATGYETAILTLNDSSCTESTIEAYSIKYFNDNFSGDGAVLVMCMYDRDWHFHFFGKADNVGKYSDTWIENTVVTYLSSGKYAEGFDVFADITNDIYTGTEDEVKYKVFDWKTGLIVALAAGLIVAFIVTSKFKNELKSVAMKANANDYTVPGSLQITSGNDVFLYSNVTRTAKPKNTSKSGGGSHSSSGGGGSHSGGGKF